MVGEVEARDAFKIGIEGEMETDSEGKKVNTLAGIFNGMTSELIHMLQDMSQDRDFYPRKAYVKFQPDQLLLDLEQSIEGVALYDLNGDGLEDIVAASPGGDYIIQQIKPMEFSDATESFGVDSSSVSVSVADFDCDGLNDLLLGNVLYKGTFEKTFGFKKTELLPLADASALKTASFVELNDDGFPDILASFEGSGLRAFLNPATEGQPFSEATDTLGLPTAGNGFVTVGDWNGDQRTDIFYAEGDGSFLVQNESGVFEVQAHDVDFIFRTGLDTYGQTGAGVFMPTYDQSKMDLIVPIEKDWIIVENRDGEPTDISKYGNEISEGSDYHLATASADLNVDGYMDIYTVSDQQKENRYIINRGYGSYMHGKIHVDDKPLFKGPAHGSGGRSLALGDVNADGAPDIVIGNAEGQLLLIVNDTPSMRVEAEFMKKDESRLLNTRLLTVRVLGPKGVVGAKVRLLNEAGEVVARQDIGGNLASGCSSPNAVNFAVREAGLYTISVIHADGREETRPIDLNGVIHMTQVITRSDVEVDNDVW